MRMSTSKKPQLMLLTMMTYLNLKDGGSINITYNIGYSLPPTSYRSSVDHNATLQHIHYSLPMIVLAACQVLYLYVHII